MTVRCPIHSLNLEIFTEKCVHMEGQWNAHLTFLDHEISLKFVMYDAKYDFMKFH